MVEKKIIKFKYAAVVPTIATAFFSFLYIDSKSIWLDEAYTILFVNNSWSNLWSILSIREANMGIYYVLLKLWVGIFGDSELAVRSLSAIFSISTTAIITYIGIRKFYFDSGVIAGILLSLNSFFIQYAQEARGYSLLLLFVAVSFLIYILCIEKYKNKYFAALGVINGLILYAHFFGFFIILSQFVSAFLLKYKRIVFKKLFESATITTLMVIPLCIFLWTTKGHQLNWIDKVSLIDIIYSIRALAGGRYRGGYILFILYSIPCLYFIWDTFKKIKIDHLANRMIWKHTLLFLWFVFPILFLYLISTIKPLFVDRYLIGSLPALVLIAGVGFFYIKWKIIRKILITLLIFASLTNLFLNYYPDKKSEWNTVVKTVLKNYHKSDAILFYSHVSKYPFEYYYNKYRTNSDELVCVWPSEFNNEMVLYLKNIDSSAIEKIAKDHSRLWVVLAHDNMAGLNWQSQPIIEKIEIKYNKISETYFKKSIKLILYENSNSFSLSDKNLT